MMSSKPGMGHRCVQGNSYKRVVYACSAYRRIMCAMLEGEMFRHEGARKRSPNTSQNPFQP
eukprot:1158902-Pelagomonas_calceolata.AAC.7